MTEKTVSIVLNGIDYTWDGQSWYETRTFATPPTAVIGQLNKALGIQLGEKPKVHNLDKDHVGTHAV